MYIADWISRSVENIVDWMSESVVWMVAGPAEHPAMDGRVNLAHTRQSRPDSGFGFRVSVLETESDPLRAVHLSRHKRPGGFVY